MPAVGRGTPAGVAYSEGEDVEAAEDSGVEVDTNQGASATDGATDSDAVAAEENKMTIDGMSSAEYEALKANGEKHEFQAEVSRMMKLIINSLYTNKEVRTRLATSPPPPSFTFCHGVAAVEPPLPAAHCFVGG